MKISAKCLKIVAVIACITVSLVATACAILLIPYKSPNSYEEIWAGAESFDISKIQTMEKKPGEEFKILQLTDTQMSSLLQSTKKLKKTVDKLVADNDPDLIVITGDIVSNISQHYSIKNIIKVVDSYGIPWAPVFGNHDSERGSDRVYLAEQMMAAKNCVMEMGPTNIGGVGNYVINVTENGAPVYSLFLMDSNSRRIYEIDGKKQDDYDYIHPTQIAWYEDNVKGIAAAAGHTVPSMTFFHIPVREYGEAYKLYEENSPEVTLVQGVKHEDECPAPVNSGMFSKVLELGSTTHMFVGHDHVNNYTLLYKGVYLTYGTKTGNLSYYKSEVNGGTLVTIGTDNTVKVDIKYVAI